MILTIIGLIVMIVTGAWFIFGSWAVYTAAGLWGGLKGLERLIPITLFSIGVGIIIVASYLSPFKITISQANITKASEGAGE